MPGQLAPTTRIIDLVHTLSEPTDYIRNILGNFVSRGYDPETSVIRIGIKGMGLAPNYKISEPSFLQTLTIGSVHATFTVTPACTFNGRNHREMTELDDLERCDDHWSNVTSGFVELRALLSSLSQSDKKQ
jgi:hypothetical protein